MTTTTEPDTLSQTIPFDRRTAARRATSGDYVAVMIDGNDSHISSVEMLDESPGGFGITSPMPMPSGAICHLHPHGVIALAEVGRVVRCTKRGDDYVIGLVSVRRLAA